MNRDEHGFEVGDRVTIRLSVSSGRSHKRVWEVAGLSEGRPGRIRLRCPDDPERTLEATRWALLLVTTIEERMAAELMSRPEKLPVGRRVEGVDFANGVDTTAWAWVDATKNNQGFDVKFALSKRRSP